MVKKIFLISLFVIFAGLLIAGAVNRTTVKANNEAHAVFENQGTVNGEGKNSAFSSARITNNQARDQQGIRQGQGIGNGGLPQGRQNLETNDSAANDGSAVQGGQGQGFGRNRQIDTAIDVNPIHESIVVEGTVVQAPSAGIDMILETAEGSLLIGTGPGYLDQQGFILTAGEVIQVTGFWENEEFKAEVISRMSDSSSVTLRDEFGRPMWSGAVSGGKGLGNQGNGRAGRNVIGPADS